MVATQQTQQPHPTQSVRHWYSDREVFLYGFVRSNYVTALTDWFMGFAGKAVELVLYATVLYSCAQLYPGVHLPAALSLAVFLIQMGALDIGGLSLGKLAKQAREDGNQAGATQAARLSKWLIGIMLVGVTTVGLEHALPVSIPAWVITSIDVALVVGRSICSVLYGRVVHDLKSEAARMLPLEEVEARLATQAEHLQQTLASRLEERHAREIAHLHATHTAQIERVEQVITARCEQVIEQARALVEQLLIAQIEQSLAAQPVITATAQSAQISTQVITPAPPLQRKTERPIEQPAHLHVVTSRGRGEPIERVRQALKKEPDATDRRLAKLSGVSPATAKKYRAQIEQETNDQVASI